MWMGAPGELAGRVGKEEGGEEGGYAGEAGEDHLQLDVAFRVRND